MYRQLIERMARGWSFRRRLPSGFGSRCVYVSPDSALQYIRPVWGPHATQLMSVATRFVTPRCIVWDIGANVGVFAIAAAHLAGVDSEVLAVEPDPFLASLLQRTALHRDNRDLTLFVLCQAVSNKKGLARFAISGGGRSQNSLVDVVGARGGNTEGSSRYVQHVPTTTLDALLDDFKPPHFIKVDVEGAESLVLEGAEALLAECRPVIYIEVGSEQRDNVTAILKRHRYRLYDGDATNGCQLDACPWNTLAVPDESSLTNYGHNEDL